MTELNLKVTTTPALLPEPDPKSGYRYLDPDNHMFCFEIVSGKIRFSTPWFFGDSAKREKMRNNHQDDLRLQIEVRCEG